MEVLSLEEKAKRYDEAIEVIRKCETDKYGCVIGIKPSDIFSELKEDELTWLKRFIKEEIDCLRYDIRDYKDSAKLDNLQRALAWVEKQGEYINFRNTAKVGDRITKSEEGVLVNLSQFERMANKDKKQELEDNLNKALEKETPESWNKFLDEQGEQNAVEPDDLIEESYQQQADDLIDMVTENPAWSEEDERNLQGIIDEIEANKNQAPDYDLATYDRFLSWLKSLKDRVGCEVDYTTTKEWSEEDEEEFQIAIDTLDKAGQHDSAHWLKSIKDRVRVQPQNKWRPSKEQLTALRNISATGVISYAGQGQELVNLYNDLKKLRK